MTERILRAIEHLVPRRLYQFFQPTYHLLLAFTGALYYRFPSKKLTVIFITGTKGKTSTAEILNNILEEDGKITAVLGTLRFKIANESKRNMRKMTIPGRFFVQKFLHDAVTAGCSHAIIEMTSEGAKQFRNKYIDADMLIFTNLAPEHIESHGSYENYRDAKLSIARGVARSSKTKRFIVANSDDKEGLSFLSIQNITPMPFSLHDGEPLEADDTHSIITFRGKTMKSSLSGLFNVYNILGAAVASEALGVSLDAITLGVEKTIRIPGRAEHIIVGQSFPIIVDYAHTPDSLEAIYSTFEQYQNICILGNTGGGRDKWKRPVMGHIAERFCSTVILTNEDPYDEDPLKIVNEIADGMKTIVPEIILDRRLAIARALTIAHDTEHSAVLITGKGTDPYIMGNDGEKTPWDDGDVAREEMTKILS